MLMNMKKILQFKFFQICEQKICTKMSNLNTGITALETLLAQVLYILRARGTSCCIMVKAQRAWVQTIAGLLSSCESSGQLLYLFWPQALTQAFLQYRISLLHLHNLANSHLADESRWQPDIGVTESQFHPTRPSLFFINE